MKTNEERYLKEAIRNVKKFAKEYPTLSSFFNHIDEVKVRSLQDLSFKYDLKFFEGISRILSVIISIVTKPVLANKGEEVIVRATSAAKLTPEMFQKLFKIPLYGEVKEQKWYLNMFIINNMLMKLKHTKIYLLLT
jgi:hypothetical protein